MSIVNFSSQLAGLSAQIQKNTQDLHELKNAVEGVSGPMDELIAKAEQAGSAVANINDVMAEMVSLNQTNWQPALQAVQWQLYEVQKTSEETSKAVSRDILDKIVPLIDEHMPNFQLWLKKILQMAADGEIGFDEMKKKMDDWASSVGARQMNSMFGDNIDVFLIEFRKLMKEIEQGKKPMTDAAAMMDRLTEKAKGAGAAIEEAVHTTAGMTSGSKGGSMGASSTSLGAPGNAEDMAARMVAALDKAARR